MNKNITLVGVDGSPDSSPLRNSMKWACVQGGFGEVLFIAHNPPVGGINPQWRVEFCASMTKNDYNIFCLYQLHNHIRTTHALTIQPDSGIYDPSEWDDDWLQYDYIGAPWPEHWSGEDNVRVGNSGFCLRSKRLLRATSQFPFRGSPWRGGIIQDPLDDVVTCVALRPQLEAMGLKFAPVEVAAKFSFELPTEFAKHERGRFGYHRVPYRLKQELGMFVRKPEFIKRNWTYDDLNPGFDPDTQHNER